MPETVTFSGIAGGPSTGQPPGHNSATRVLPRDRVREAYLLYPDHSMFNRTPEANSLETLHNWMHNRTGGGGHMSNPISASACLLQFPHQSVVDRFLLRFRSNLHASPYQCQLTVLEVSLC